MERLLRVLHVPVIVQRSPEWFAKRASRVTSSVGLVDDEAVHGPNAQLAMYAKYAKYAKAAERAERAALASAPTGAVGIGAETVCDDEARDGAPERALHARGRVVEPDPAARDELDAARDGLAGVERRGELCGGAAARSC